MTIDPSTSTSALGTDAAGMSSPAFETVRSEEHATVTATWVPESRVRLRRRIITENREVTVSVRREELVIDREPVGGDSVDGVLEGAPGPVEPLVLVLAEEVPVVNLVVQPYEQVTVSVEQVTVQQPVTATLRSEQIRVETDRH